MRHSQDIGKRERQERAAERSRKKWAYYERIGNAHIANGLVLKARAAYRVADAIKKEEE